MLNIMIYFFRIFRHSSFFLLFLPYFYDSRSRRDGPNPKPFGSIPNQHDREDSFETSF